MTAGELREQLLATGRQVVAREAQAVARVTAAVGSEFARACELILGCSGRVVCLGVGKSGIIARKAAATLSSLGTPALFVHAAEAVHGDLGMITPDDLLMVFSHSGATPEVVAVLPALQRLTVPLIAVTDRPDSPLGRAAGVRLCPGVGQEADHLGLAPTSSTTAAVVLADAVAVAVAAARGFGRDDFARVHPGGSLGAGLARSATD